jgi:heme-degrading monooxygenase HmoA
MKSEFLNERPGVVVEWAPFELADGRAEEGLLEASAAFQEAFLATIPGFQRRELLHQPGSRQWVDLVYWDSADAAAAAFKAAEESEACALYFSYMKPPEGSEPDIHSGVQHFRLAATYAAREGALR